MKRPSLSIYDPACPAWYRRYVEGKRVPRRQSRGRLPGALCHRDRRSRTGCVGVSYVETANGKAHGRTRRFFAAHAGGTNRKFCIDTLGKQEAWRRALRYRATYELTVRGERGAAQ